MDSARQRSELASAIRDFLGEADREGRLPILRGMINRNDVCRKFSFPHFWTQSGEIKRVLIQYDGILRSRGYRKSKFDGDLGRVRQFLEAGLVDGSIPVTGRRVNRAAIRKTFGYSQLVFHRHAGLRALLEQFDARLTEEHFQKTKYQAYVKPMRQLIEDCLEGRKPIPLYQGRLNSMALAKKLELPEYVFRAVPDLNQILVEANQRLADRKVTYLEEHNRKGVRNVRPHLILRNARHRRSWDFNQIADQFSELAALGIARAFCKYCSGYSEGRAKGQYHALLRVFAWLHGKAAEYPDVVAAICRAERPKLDEFEWACSKWRQEQIHGGEQLKQTTANRRIKIANTALRHLAAAGILPRIRDLRPVRGARSKSKPRESVAEIARFADVAKDILRTAARAHDVDIDSGDESAFLRVLNEEARTRNDLPDDFVAAIRIILSDRLAALRACAVKDFLKWSRHFDEGQRLLATADMVGRSIEDLVYSRAVRSFDRRMDLVRALPPRDPARALSRFLALIEHRWEGCPPRGTNPETLRDRGPFYNRFYQKHGGYQRIDAFLNAHPEMIIAAIVMYLVDTGANVSTARTLDVDCLQPSEVAGHKRISGFKARAQGNVIFSDLPVKAPSLTITTVQAVEMLAKMTARYRHQASDDDASRLFLVRPQSHVILLPEHLLTS